MYQKNLSKQIQCKYMQKFGRNLLLINSLATYVCTRRVKFVHKKYVFFSKYFEHLTWKFDDGVSHNENERGD